MTSEQSRVLNELLETARGLRVCGLVSVASMSRIRRLCRSGKADVKPKRNRPKLLRLVVASEAEFWSRMKPANASKLRRMLRTRRPLVRKIFDVRK